MKRTLLPIALWLGLGTASAAEPLPSAPAGAAGQAPTTEAARAELAELRTQMRELSTRMAKLSTELGDAGPRAYALRYLGNPDRALLGVVLAADPKGARISAVTPDSPAARAGLRDGDVIVAIDGHRLANAKNPEEALRTTRERLGDLKDGQDVRIDWERGAKAQPMLHVKASRRTAYTWPRIMAGAPGSVVELEQLDAGTRASVDQALAIARSVDTDRIRADVDHSLRQARVAMHRAMPWRGLNLVPLNADLGRYFGTARGTLVVSVEASAGSGLRGGDVITEVAGEKVADPGEVMRALRDHAPGENVPVKVLRERKAVALTIRTPEFNSIFDIPPPPAPPQPPAPPVAPKAASAPTPPAPPAPPPGAVDET